MVTSGSNMATSQTQSEHKPMGDVAVTQMININGIHSMFSPGVFLPPQRFQTPVYTSTSLEKGVKYYTVARYMV